MGGLDRGETHIRGVVSIQVMRNLVEGSARVPKIGAGTRATGMRSDARRVQAKPRVMVRVKVGDLGRGRGCNLSRPGRRHIA